LHRFCPLQPSHRVSACTCAKAEVENASGTLTTHTWNDENQLTQVAKTGMTTNQYTFNGDGQRVQIVDSQGTKKPIWDFQNILLETDGSNVTQVVYTLEPAPYGNLISQRRSSTTSYYLFDAVGSTRKLTGSASSITDSYDFRAYGETYASTIVTTNVFRWVGELGYYLDIDRLAYYLRVRPFHPVIGRFLSQDPIGFKGSHWNLYEYVRSMPIYWVDPSGMESWLDCVHADLCRTWARKEEWLRKTKLGKWEDQLPDCPCHVNDVHTGAVEDGWTWGPPGPPEGGWHPNAKLCRRASGKRHGPGQQCCYDSSGRLITGGISAGTPDIVSPEWRFHAPDHFDKDVAPAIHCWKGGLYEYYYLKYRPPNNGKNCPPNNK
jgi:RHS repeat-associated protein